MKLNALVQFTNNVQPACLPELGWGMPDRAECYTTGWGGTKGELCIFVSFNYLEYASVMSKYPN